MCGIFGYYTYETPRSRQEIVETLLTGLRRQEYRGYDSAGVAVDDEPLPELEPLEVAVPLLSLALPSRTGSAVGTTVRPGVASGAPGGLRVAPLRELPSPSASASQAPSALAQAAMSEGGGSSCCTPLSPDGAESPRSVTAGPRHSAPPTRVIKCSGKVADLAAHVYQTLSENSLPLDTVFRTQAGIAHTRWATHGEPSARNAHPIACQPSADFVVVHNGIITNYAPLRSALQRRGARFVTDTDTEVIPVLLEYLHTTLPEPISFPELVLHALRELEGAFGLLVTSRLFPGSLVAARRGSPLLVGIRVPGDADATATGPRPGGSAVELFFASDAAALVEHTKRVVVLEDGDVVHAWDGGYDIFDADAFADDSDDEAEAGAGANAGAGAGVGSASASASGSRVAERAALDGSSASRKASTGSAASPWRRRPASRVSRALQTLEMEVDTILKGSYDTFMAKEIHEQPDSLQSTLRGRVRALPPLAPGAPPRHAVKLGGLTDHLENIARSRRLVMVACGTSFHACLAVRPTFEALVPFLPVSAELASDLLDRDVPISRQDTCIFVSQSGETADTLQVLERAKARGAFCVGVTNVVASSIARGTQAGVYVNAGAEIGVASTKAYTSQIVALTLIALSLGGDSLSRHERRENILESLAQLPDAARRALLLEPAVKELADELKDSHGMLIFGRGPNLATALEGALKIKEVALLHAEGLAAGELKHGPLALVDETMPALVVAVGEELNGKMVSVVEQLLARKAKLYVLANEGDERILDLCRSRASVLEVPRIADSLAPVVAAVPLQLLAYHLARLRGFDVDQPRNLAKSVTVTEDDPHAQKRHTKSVLFPQQA